jgi:hypothetical protein
MKALVVSVGGKNISLGALKLVNYLRRTTDYEVEHSTAIPLKRFDLYCFSCVFSWHLPDLVRMVQFAKLFGEVWIGGPAVTFHPDNARYVERETGIAPHTGLDDRFEQEPGTYPMVYFSRGCPAYTAACGVCPVPRIEGNAFRYYPDAAPARMLLDNNLSALPAEYQDHIIARYKADYRGRGLVDANSGFEPHSFNQDTLRRWREFPLAFWRFGYDDLSERNEALSMLNLLNCYGYKGQKVRVYTLIGNEPIQYCYQRVREVIGPKRLEPLAHPWPQRLKPLNYLGGPLPTKFDWDEPTLIAFQRFFSIAGLWKRMEPREFFYQGRYPLAMLN